MRHRDVLNCHSAMLYALVALFALLCPSAGAPAPVHSMAYATVDEKTLYIQGGDPGQDGNLSNQFYSLDLTQSNWDISNPPWSTLATGAANIGALATANHFMTVVDGGQSLMVWSSLISGSNSISSESQIVKYSISRLTWLTRQSSDLGSNYSTVPRFAKSGATDPATNFVYIPSVFQNDTGMTVYNATSTSSFQNSAKSAPMPTPLVRGGVLTGHSTVWSDYRNRMLVYGGRYEVPGSGPTAPSPPTSVLTDQFVEYNPTLQTWAHVETKGKSPGNRTRHCMVPAYGGRKMVVFGGSTGSNADIVPQGDIYVLDLSSMTWSQGISASSTNFRAAMACSVAGNNFLAWGGTNSLITLNSTIVYNFRINQWTDRFSLDASSSGASSDTSIMGDIIGGSAAAVLFISILIGYVIYRRRKQRSLQNQVTRQDYELQAQDWSKHDYDVETTKRNPHEPVDSLTLKGVPRNPAVISMIREFHFPPGHQAGNPEYVPQLTFQGFQRTDPQYSDTPLQEPWRNPHGMAIPEHIIEDERLRQQWIVQQQQADIFQQQQQLYLDELERLRLEYEQLQTCAPSPPTTTRSYPHY
ncbi:hypothetical protein BGZ96_010256 [Linnemannia gamsii]|uniref:Galactose oxidase n=1 Tax=Linnemannia gamsii TaxID=64522 RepID=A0ABQ7JWI9_9FUNG|nr:hypothetical protein BGZ96_010256 [Linnemannia gamsii]